MNRRILFLLPLFLVIILFFFFQQGLKQDPKLLPSTLIGQPAPAFSLKTFQQQRISEKIFLNHDTLFNVWASWCATCQQEQAYLLKLKRQYPKLQIIGLNYKDNSRSAQNWLKQYGNPYQWVAEDQTGRTSMDYGSYGTPETFLIGPDGKILAKQIGVLDEATFRKFFLPLLQN
jgi:cytochrome c biogenesis protein CcmG/thiol:disulfide interchange protein DsbE